MKNIFILIFFFISFQTFSQVKKNYLKIGVQTGRTAYLQTPAYGYDVQCQLASKDKIFFTLIGLGHVIANGDKAVNLKGTAGTRTWDYDFKFPSRERYFYVEINALVAFQKKKEKRKRLKSKFGGGFTLLSNRLSYYDNVLFGIGGILDYETTKRNHNAIMANLVLDSDLSLSNDLVLNFRYTIRKNIIKQPPLKRRIYRSQYSSTTRTSKFEFLTSLVIGLGYCF